ncbi:hypothetical protein [Psychrobacter sp. 1Y4]|uniref:hypothetical protein n=1 Tax=Psychrobacter sp. 1Y4 TaxID=3453575 RepID=UPI003F47D9A3
MRFELSSGKNSQSYYPLLPTYLGVAWLRFGAFLFDHDTALKTSLSNTPFQAG